MTLCIEAAREETDPEKRREAMNGMFEQMKQMREDIRSVLTDEQKKKFEELIAASPRQGPR